MIQRRIFMFGIWECTTTQFLRRYLKPGDTFIDLGAHVGYHTLCASQFVGERGKVVAIEGSPEIYELLKKNIAANSHARNVIVRNVIVASKLGKVPFYRGTFKNTGMGTILHVEKGGLVGWLPAVPLQVAINQEEIEQAKVIKIDIEGSEILLCEALGIMVEKSIVTADIILEVSPGLWKRRREVFKRFLETCMKCQYNIYRIHNVKYNVKYMWPFVESNSITVISSINVLLKEHQTDIILSKKPLKNWTFQ